MVKVWLAFVFLFALLAFIASVTQMEKDAGAVAGVVIFGGIAFVIGMLFREDFKEASDKRKRDAESRKRLEEYEKEHPVKVVSRSEEMELVRKQQEEYERERAERERQELAFTKLVLSGKSSWKDYLRGVQTGEGYEQKIMKVAQTMGYTAWLTKASGDQGVDILIFAKGHKIAVQCKWWDSPVGNSAVQEVFAGKAFYGCDIAWVVANQPFTESAIELSKKTDVVLMLHNEFPPHLRVLSPNPNPIKDDILEGMMRNI